MKKYILLSFLIAFFTQTALAGETAWQKSYNFEAKGKYQKATSAIEPLTRKGNNKEFAWLRLGWLNYLQANYNDAKEAYRQALRINPKSLDARLGLVKPLLAQQRWREAELQIKKVLQKAPLNLSANLVLMAIHQHNKDWKALQDLAYKLLRYYPGSADSWVYLARAYAWQKQVKLAKQSYQRVLAIFPKNLEAEYYLSHN